MLKQETSDLEQQ